jgi:hypothetical protein
MQQGRATEKKSKRRRELPNVSAVVTTENVRAHNTIELMMSKKCIDDSLKQVWTAPESIFIK